MPPNFLNKTRRNILNQARKVSLALGLGNVIREKRLTRVLNTIPRTAKQTYNALKEAGLKGGKRKTRKQKRKHMTRRRR